ncbi:hypothetical protein EGW08_017408 [Elysia chlorotica]|uniref:Uncharacterized protein n=1 Tax=Elysia chlorotica TaxID=188477 RepID=A0A3S1AXK1_ELYCH|nr:hypothetical protein EGW08_017408 [Elysia chlorotica]
MSKPNFSHVSGNETVGVNYAHLASEVVFESVVDSDVVVKSGVDSEVVVESCVDSEVVVESGVDSEVVVESGFYTEVVVESCVDSEVVVKSGVDSEVALLRVVSTVRRGRMQVVCEPSTYIRLNFVIRSTVCIRCAYDWISYYMSRQKVVQWQRKQYQLLQANLPKGHAVCTVDFAENYLYFWPLEEVIIKTDTRSALLRAPSDSLSLKPVKQYGILYNINVFQSSHRKCGNRKRPFVTALEYATDVTATVVGKPAENFFLASVAEFGCVPQDCLTVGDDVRDDVGGARSAGMRGLLVRTGNNFPFEGGRT